MVTKEILSLILNELHDADAFPSLTIGRDLFMTPTITWNHGSQPFVIQVAEGGATAIEPRDGGVFRAQFEIIVGITIRCAKDHGGRYHSSLLRETNGFFDNRDKIVSKLHMNYLLDEGSETLVRPLMYTREDRPQENSQVRDILVKRVYFTGGVNAEQ
jgi:hypothetical protein